MVFKGAFPKVVQSKAMKLEVYSMITPFRLGMYHELQPNTINDIADDDAP